jgi:hypothetical protein
VGVKLVDADDVEARGHLNHKILVGNRSCPPFAYESKVYAWYMGRANGMGVTASGTVSLRGGNTALKAKDASLRKINVLGARARGNGIGRGGIDPSVSGIGQVESTGGGRWRLCFRSQCIAIIVSTSFGKTICSVMVVGDRKSVPPDATR